MLKIEKLVKQYKSKKEPTLKELDLEVLDGEIFGLVGKNGTGKSTTIKCFTGILPFEKGTISINDVDMLKNPKEAKQNIGYVPDDHSVYDRLTGREYINFMADIYGVNLEDRTKFIDEYSKIFNLTDSLDTQISGYSHGMRQKICMIGAIVHHPNLWVLDEPMLGLDPQSTITLINCIKNYVKDGKRSVIFSSHNLETVQKVCDRVGIIHNGIVAEIIDLHNKNKEYNLEQAFIKYLENV